MVVTDNLDGAGQATRHLIALGHRHITIAGTTPDAFPSILERRRGYLSAMSAARLEPAFADGHDDEPDVVAAKLGAILSEGPEITAIVAATNDAVALAIHAELGDRVPHRISLVGFDDIEAASLVRPRLDTVSVDKLAMGRLAVSLLLHRIRHPHDPAFVAMQPAGLVVRDTSAAPPTSGP